MAMWCAYKYGIEDITVQEQQDNKCVSMGTHGDPKGKQWCHG